MQIIPTLGLDIAPTLRLSEHYDDIAPTWRLSTRKSVIIII